jgi:hypothetical protein
MKNKHNFDGLMEMEKAEVKSTSHQATARELFLWGSNSFSAIAIVGLEVESVPLKYCTRRQQSQSSLHLQTHTFRNEKRILIT